MKLRNLIAPSAIIGLLFPLSLVAPPPAYAASWGHIYVDGDSLASVSIYSEWLTSGDNRCAGSRVVRGPGTGVTSEGWDCFRSSRRMLVQVYSGSTGNLLAIRDYGPYTDVRAYKENDYYTRTI